MRRVMYYSHEIFSVLVLVLLTASAVFVTPDVPQAVVLVFAFLFLLHEWEENDYPGGFFDMLLREVANIRPVPSGARLRESRVGVYLLLSAFIFPPYFLHEHAWLVLPIVYLGIFEGIAHTLVIHVFRLKRRYTPGMVTALCQITASVAALVVLAGGHLIEGWQYAAAVLILIAGLACMATIGMTHNGLRPTDMPRMMLRNLRAVRAGEREAPEA